VNVQHKISIITVVYNAELTIEDTIKAVLAQSYSRVEYIIVDGGSKDKTLSIIEKYKDRLGKFVSEKDKGIYDAMNKGVQMATGDVIGILNSDDLYSDDAVIEDVMHEFNKDSDLGMLYGDLVYVKKTNVDKIVRNWRSLPYYKKFFEHANVPPHPALFVRKKVYDELGMFNLTYKLASDYEFMLRIFKSGRFTSAYINRLIVKMRLGGATNNSVGNIVQGNREIIKAWKNNKLSVPFYLLPLRVIKRLLQFVS
jgi:glycosyltransferase involved in cell wall biosynthesis